MIHATLKFSFELEHSASFPNHAYAPQLEFPLQLLDRVRRA